MNLGIQIFLQILDNSQKVKTTQCPLTYEWINKMGSVHTMGYYSDLERKEILTHAPMVES